LKILADIRRVAERLGLQLRLCIEQCGQQDTQFEDAFRDSLSHDNLPVAPYINGDINRAIRGGL
jgi:hypothetical protein